MTRATSVGASNGVRATFDFFIYLCAPVEARGAYVPADDCGLRRCVCVYATRVSTGKASGSFHSSPHFFSCYGFRKAIPSTRAYFTIYLQIKIINLKNFEEKKNQSWEKKRERELKKKSSALGLREKKNAHISHTPS